MARGDRIAVEVAYSPGPAQLEIISLELDEGSTLAQALELSGLLGRYPVLQKPELACGVWGRPSELQHPLRDRDRVEIYRQLKVDPKEARRQRYAEHQVRFGRKALRR